MVSTRQKAMYVLCTRQNGCGNPDRAPMKASSHPGLRLQGVPQPFTGNGSSENSCVRCDQVDDLLSLVAEL